MHCPPAEPFFLDAAPGPGQRFCIYHAPNPELACRGAILYIHPFAEEMNKSRRMSALQANAFAAAGFAVLRIDLFGCGDSSGDFGEARWDIWKDDLAKAKAWLAQHISAPISLWGLRLGGLLALDFARGFPGEFHKIILWQPIIKGDLFLTQFLRLRVASDMLSGDHEKKSGTLAMRDSLASGQAVEVAGYEIAPALAASLSALDAAGWMPSSRNVEWFEIVSAAKASLPPAVEKVARAWKNAGLDLRMHQVSCQPFWSTQEIAACPELLDATTQVFGQVHS